MSEQLTGMDLAVEKLMLETAFQHLVPGDPETNEAPGVTLPPDVLMERAKSWIELLGMKTLNRLTRNGGLRLFMEDGIVPLIALPEDSN